MALAIASTAILASILIMYFTLVGQHDSTGLAESESQPELIPNIHPTTMLGTNIGGWLCLEDWLFSEGHGRTVAPWMGSDGQGRSLPPAATYPMDRVIGTPEWPSEGILAKRMNRTIGPEATIAAFEAHRRSFVTSQDFADMVRSGVQAVRLPLSWHLFADALAPLSDVYRGANEKTTIVPDPVYHQEVAAVTIPRAFVADRLREAGAAGLKVTLDMHSFPGGAQDGTYNGIWPLRPAFWSNYSNVGRPVRMLEVGLWISEALIRWVEVELDSEARSAIHALQFMNEPGHMNYAPPYARAYHPFAGYATEDDIVDWLDNATSLFRRSSLPQAGVKVLVSLVETAFEDFYTVAPQWFNRTFSPADRSTWVIVGHQYYAAYSPHCDSKPGAQGGDGYTCTASVNESRLVMRRCVQAFQAKVFSSFTKKDWPHLAVTEFSLGTANDVLQACFDRDVLAAFWQEQMEGFALAGATEVYFWSWKMPQAPCFEPGWSLRHFASNGQPSPKCLARGAYQA